MRKLCFKRGRRSRPEPSKLTWRRSGSKWPRRSSGNRKKQSEGGNKLSERFLPPFKQGKGEGYWVEGTEMMKGDGEGDEGVWRGWRCREGRKR